MTRQQVEEAMVQAAQVDSRMTKPMPADTVKTLSRGAFVSADGIHKGSGMATIYQVGQERVLRLDPFESTNGPDLYLYLSPNPAPRNSAQLHDGGAFEVGRLKGNIGTQNYGLPAGVDLGKHRSVVVHCRRFHVVFSSAELKTP
jgi:hypothetical protein